jgi:hypothetical protein
MTMEPDQVERVRMIHACGWTRGTALCGASAYTAEHPKPRRPDCVVCWDIWKGMDLNARRALWKVYE